jgi:hypothetical protein
MQPIHLSQSQMCHLAPRLLSNHRHKGSSSYSSPRLDQAFQCLEVVGVEGVVHTFLLDVTPAETRKVEARLRDAAVAVVPAVAGVLT